MNLAESAAARMMTEREFKRIFDDIVYEIAKHTSIEHVFIIKNHNTAIGAEPGSVFLVTGDKGDSLKVDASDAGHTGDARHEVQRP